MARRSKRRTTRRASAKRKLSRRIVTTRDEFTFKGLRRRRLGDSPAQHGFQLVQAAGNAARQADQGYELAYRGDCHQSLMHIIRSREYISEADTHAVSGARDPALNDAKQRNRMALVAFGKSCEVVPRRRR